MLIQANTTELKFNNWTKQYPKPADAATGEAFFLSQVARHITLNEKMEYPKVYLDKKMDFDDPTRGSQISRQDIDGVFVDDTTSGQSLTVTHSVTHTPDEYVLILSGVILLVVV